MADDTPDQDTGPGANVTAAELVRGFAKWRETALNDPVFISTHGRVTHVLTNADQFRSMAQAATNGDGQVSLYGLADYVREGVLVIDPDERIIYNNPYAKSYFGFPDNSVGMGLLELLPALAGTMFTSQLRRTAISREPLTADLPSALNPGRWIHYQTIPLQANVVVTFRDITEEVTAHRLADVKEVTIQAISLHPDVGYIRISPTGTIDRADDTFSEWIGLSASRLHGVKIVDLIARESRVEVAEALDGVLRGGPVERFRALFTTNHDKELYADCVMVGLHGAYGLEGAVIIFTRAKN